jgi:hypothetical protein
VRGSPTWPSHHAQRTRPAHGILEQLKTDAIADSKIIERSAVAQIAAMKENLAILQTDETVTLTNEELGNTTGRGLTLRIIPRRLARNVRSTLTSGAVEIFSTHVWSMSIRRGRHPALFGLRRCKGSSNERWIVAWYRPNVKDRASALSFLAARLSRRLPAWLRPATA